MACQDLKHGDRGVEGGERWEREGVKCEFDLPR